MRIKQSRFVLSVNRAAFQERMRYFKRCSGCLEVSECFVTDGFLKSLLRCFAFGDKRTGAISIQTPCAIDNFFWLGLKNKKLEKKKNSESKKNTCGLVTTTGSTGAIGWHGCDCIIMNIIRSSLLSSSSIINMGRIELIETPLFGV